MGAAVAAERQASLYAADIEPAAVRCARRNLTAFGKVYQGDLFDALPKRLRVARYTPVAKRTDRPDGIAYVLRNYPQLNDVQIAKLMGTTKETIQRGTPNSSMRSIASGRAASELVVANPMAAGSPMAAAKRRTEMRPAMRIGIRISRINAASAP